MHARYRLSLMLGGLVAFVAAVTAVNIGVNPYRAWPVSLVDAVYTVIAFVDERVSTPYRIHNEQPTTVLLGTSRVFVGMQIEQGARDGVLNAALSGARLEEVIALARAALTRPTVRRIVLGADYVTFSAGWVGVFDPQLEARLRHAPLLRARETVFNLDVLRASGRQLVRLARGRAGLPPSRLRPVPWDEGFIREQLEALIANPGPPVDPSALELHSQIWRVTYARHQPSPVQWAMFAQLVEEVRAHAVELIVFVPPFSHYELDSIRAAARWPAFQEWKRDLARATPYWDFSGYTAIARRDELYTMPVFSHFRPVVGHAILRHLLGQRCDQCGPIAHAIIASGVRIDADTVDAHLEQQDRAVPPVVDTGDAGIHIVHGGW
jgi:hypothetical protein